MKRSNFWLLILAGVLFMAIAFSPAARAAYIGVDLFTILTPAGFSFPNPQDAAGGQVAGWSSVNDVGGFHAFLWSAPGGAAVDLNPNGFLQSQAYGVGGGQQVGSGFGTATGGNNMTHAVLWSGTAASAVDLGDGLGTSQAYGVGGGQQVGSGVDNLNGNFHALLWSGTAASVVDLHPSGFLVSYAYGIGGGRQVGAGSGFNTNQNSHALLWSGTAASAVDLNPSGFLESTALGVGDGQEVGFGTTAGNKHALLWSGTAASAVDLNPSGYSSSQANGVGGGRQVGQGFSPTGYRALLWSGTAASAVDLNALLPVTLNDSNALSIDAATGTIYGLAFDANGNEHAVEWMTSILPRDFNLDGHVNAADIPAMLSALTNLNGYQTINSLTNSQLLTICDVNGDGSITNADLQALLDLLKSGGGSVAAVPEPASIVLGLAGFAGLGFVTLWKKFHRT